MVMHLQDTPSTIYVHWLIGFHVHDHAPGCISSVAAGCCYV